MDKFLSPEGSKNKPVVLDEDNEDVFEEPAKPSSSSSFKKPRVEVEDHAFADRAQAPAPAKKDHQLWADKVCFKV
jgi:hypothetical protein